MVDDAEHDVVQEGERENRRWPRRSTMWRSRGPHTQRGEYNQHPARVADPVVVIYSSVLERARKCYGIENGGHVKAVTIIVA